VPPPVAKPEVDRGLDRTCPNCGTLYKSKVKICVDCGIDLLTGRPLVTSRGIDVDLVYHNAELTAEWLSWILFFGIVPIASEAYGKFKPYAIQAIALLTVLVTVSVWIVNFQGGDPPWGPTSNLMLWSGDRPSPELIQSAYRFDDPASQAFQEKEREIVFREVAKAEEAARLKAASQALSTLTPRQRAMLGQILRGMQKSHSHSDSPLPEVNMDLDDLSAMPALAESPDQMTLEAYNDLPQQYKKIGFFHYYQLVTNAFLHGGILHIAGNMVFLLVFGNRINALVGHFKAAFLYFALAIISSLSFYFSQLGHPILPELGASGAIMGMAGMYIILMPVSRVHVLCWFRVGFMLPLTLLAVMMGSGMTTLIIIFIVPVIIGLVPLMRVYGVKVISVRG